MDSDSIDLQEIIRRCFYFILNLQGLKIQVVRFGDLRIQNLIGGRDSLRKKKKLNETKILEKYLLKK
jgi:hypothetical protein